MDNFVMIWFDLEKSEKNQTENKLNWNDFIIELHTSHNKWMVYTQGTMIRESIL